MAAKRQMQLAFVRSASPDRLPGRALRHSSSIAKSLCVAICLTATNAFAEDVYSASKSGWTVVGQTTEQYCSVYRDVSRTGSPRRLQVDAGVIQAAPNTVLAQLNEELKELLGKNDSSGDAKKNRLEQRLGRLETVRSRDGHLEIRNVFLHQPGAVWNSREQGRIMLGGEVIGFVSAAPSEGKLNLQPHVGLAERALIKRASDDRRLAVEVPWTSNLVVLTAGDYKTARQLLLDCADEILQ